MLSRIGSSFVDVSILFNRRFSLVFIIIIIITISFLSFSSFLFYLYLASFFFLVPLLHDLLLRADLNELIETSFAWSARDGVHHWYQDRKVIELAKWTWDSVFFFFCRECWDRDRCTKSTMGVERCQRDTAFGRPANNRRFCRRLKNRIIAVPDRNIFFHLCYELHRRIRILHKMSDFFDFSINKMMIQFSTGSRKTRKLTRFHERYIFYETRKK